ncbi:hypothetical protein TNCT_280021 [Trichonephila clavata]|uniref:Uncharacterized protein n=1 Tax=Trichonephila clavata TaxID=2740835 RepID=A0A8X6FVH3_TRICU|nr:hypothetical protein TNCT_280021 [Trichonephila clavata]
MTLVTRLNFQKILKAPFLQNPPLINLISRSSSPDIFLQQRKSKKKEKATSFTRGSMIVRDKTNASRVHRFYQVHKSSRADAFEEITSLSKIVDDWKLILPLTPLAYKLQGYSKIFKEDKEGFYS